MPFEDRYAQWQAPAWDARETTKLGWINESCQQGENWAKSQRGHQDWLKGLEILSGDFSERELLEYRSNISGNRLKTNVEVSVAGLSSIRPWGGFQACDPFKPFALMTNQVTRALYLAGFWDQSIKAALQWSASTCTGWLRPVYRRGMAGQGKGNIFLDAFGMPSILPVQMPADGDYQRAYSVTLLDEKPIWEAHGMWPTFQDRLKPTNSRYWYSAQIRKASQQNADRRWNPFGTKDKNGGGECLIPIRYTTVNDLAINMTGKTILMGEPGSPWAYDVPSFNQVISDGHGGNRKATSTEARLYPFRRMMISSQDCILYDGPAFNWHGELDLIPFCLDKWPWEPMGFSMVHTGYKLQKALDQIDRGTMDKIVADLDRPLAYNMNAVTKGEAGRVDLMQPRQRIAFDGDAVDKPFQTIAPDEVYRVSAESLNFRKSLQEDLDYIMQSRDIVELSKSRALGKGMDQLEALISANGPLVKDKSRAMEKAVCACMRQIKYLIYQFMDTSRLIAYIDDAGVPQVFDYEPSSLVPSHLPGEKTVDENHEPVASPTSRTQRARWVVESITETLTPHSIHEIHQMNYRLMLMQMKQRGYHIAECDILEANDIPDVERATGSTTQERYWDEQFRTLEKMLELKTKAAGLVDVGAMLGNAGDGSQPEGRPPSGQSPPELVQKSDGRPTISESQ